MHVGAQGSAYMQQSIKWLAPQRDGPACPKCTTIMWLTMAETFEGARETRTHRCPMCRTEVTGPVTQKTTEPK